MFSDVHRRGALLALGVTVLLVSGALAAQASAATLSVNAACYVLAGKTAPPMAFTGSGYTPGDNVLVSSKDGSVDTSATADANGNITGTTTAPTPFFGGPGAKAIGLTAEDDTTAGTTITGATSVNVTVFGWEHGATKKRPGLGAFTERTNWSFSGFIPGRLIYGHYLYGGKQVARAKFGRAAAPCGTLKVRAKLFPATPHHKSYKVQYDDAKQYSKTSKPHIIGPLSLSAF